MPWKVHSRKLCCSPYELSVMCSQLRSCLHCSCEYYLFFPGKMDTISFNFFEHKGVRRCPETIGRTQRKLLPPLAGHSQPQRPSHRPQFVVRAQKIQPPFYLPSKVLIFWVILLKKLSHAVLMLCASSDRGRPFSYHTKWQTSSILVFCPFSREKHWRKLRKAYCIWRK